MTSLAEAYVQGVEVDWMPLLAGGRRVDLPTYPFQRQRYWLNADDTDATLHDHPFISTVTTPADSGTTVFTGRLAPDRMPWLAEHYPDLVPRYEEMYRKPYGPPSDRDALGRGVGDLIRDLGGLHSANPRADHRNERRKPQGPAAEQLTLV